MGQLEQRLFRSYWDDGLLDLFGGMGVLGIGLFWLFDLPVGAAVLPALLVPVWDPVRSRLVEPRMGLVEFSGRRRQRNRQFLTLVLLAGCLTLALAVILFVVVRRNGLAADVSFISALPAALLGLLALLTGLLIGSWRFTAYAAWLACAGLAGALMGGGPGAALVAGGTPIAVCGACLLRRFLQRHPLDR